MGLGFCEFRVVVFCGSGGGGVCKVVATAFHLVWDLGRWVSGSCGSGTCLVILMSIINLNPKLLALLLLLLRPFVCRCNIQPLS